MAGAARAGHGGGMDRRVSLRTLRTWARWAFWPALVLLTLNVEKLGEKFGLDVILVEHAGPAVGSVLDFIQSGWVQYPATFLLGLAAGVWLDARLRRREQQPSPIPVTPSRRAEPDDDGRDRTATLDFAGRSNAALKELAFQVGRELRAFEAGYFGEGARIRGQADASQSEGGRDYHRQVVGAEYIEHKRRADADWRVRLHPRAQAVRHELRRRLGEFSTRSGDHRASAIEDGSLAGNRALTEAAVYLEDLARRLPD